eukprot:6200539-Pleurochrysis_carterae.AAC.3
MNKVSPPSSTLSSAAKAAFCARAYERVVSQWMGCCDGHEGAGHCPDEVSRAARKSACLRGATEVFPIEYMKLVAA